MTNETNTQIHVGAIIKKYFVDAKIYKSALARTLGVNDAVVLAYEKRTSTTTATLLKLSHALKHNFFGDIAALLPKDYTTTAPVDNSNSIKIAQLEQEIIMLNREKNLLLEALKKS